MSEYMEFGFGSGDEGFQNKASRYKGKEGRTDRLSLVWWPVDDDGKPNLGAKSPRFVGANRGYKKGVGYFLVKGPEYAKLGRPKKAIATIVVKWPSDNDGTLDRDRLTSGFQVLSWTFSKIRYDQLARLHNEWSLGEHDFLFACEDTQYQKGTLTPCKESVFRSIMENEKAAPIQAKIAADIRTDLARDLSLDEIREKAGMDSPSITGASVDAGVVDDLLDSIGTS